MILFIIFMAIFVQYLYLAHYPVLEFRIGATILPAATTF